MKLNIRFEIISEYQGGYTFPIILGINTDWSDYYFINKKHRGRHKITLSLYLLFYKISFRLYKPC